MTEFFESLEDYLPAIFWFTVWGLVAPFRLLICLLMPLGSSYRSHRLHRAFTFFAFRGKQ